MRSFRPAFYAFVFWPTMAATAFTAERASPAAANACDLICEMQDYLNRDHMVTLVPAPDLGGPRPGHASASPKPKPLAATPKPSRLKSMDAAAVAPLPAPRAAIKPVPRRIAQWIPAAVASPLDQASVYPTPPIIPGAAPVVMSGFVPPAGEARH